MKAAGVEVEPYWPGLFAKALEGINAKDLITNVGSGVGAAPAAGTLLHFTDTPFFYFNILPSFYSEWVVDGFYY